MMKKILFSTVLCLMMWVQVHGQPIPINGIFYYINTEVEVFRSMGTPYTGNIVIPSTITGTIIGGMTYNVTRIGNEAFAGCSDLISVTIPSTVTSIGGWAFYNCSNLISVNIPESVTSIDSVVFAGCSSLASIVIPESVTRIRGGAFVNCTSLTSVIFPNGLTSIGSWAFAGCVGLTSIINLNSVPTFLDSSDLPVFLNVNKNECTLYVPAGSKKAYLGADEWQDFNIVELPEISENDITVTPTDTTATFEWQPVENAAGYRLIIYSDESRTDIVCILEFDFEGNLLRSGSEKFSHTIKNLSNKENYYYTFEILGIGNAVLGSLSGEFFTDSEQTGVVETRLIAPLREIGYYTLSGAKLPKEPERGLYIIKYSDGKAEKVMK